MRIQHNIAAMNSYRNFSANSSKLQKNLEKLSTGYKINRAGDDAAGLAISEKMRAQITGLDGATRNAKDGISLVQTAEGALTEVHDMLNRMVTLTEQSANGTYDNSLDRDQLQKEVDQLKSEIDRIADSTNYNGIKLLDGSLSGGGTLNGNVKLNNSIAIAAVVTTSALTAVTQSDQTDKLQISVNWRDNNGKEQQTNLTFHYAEDKKGLISEYDGTEYAVAATNTTTDTEMQTAILGELQKQSNLTAAFDIDKEGTNAFKFTSKVKGLDGAVINSVDTKFTNSTTGVTSKAGSDQINRGTTGDSVDSKDEVQKVDFTNLKVLTAANVETSGDIQKAVRENTFTIDGHKFAFVGNGETTLDKVKSYIDSDTTIIQLKDFASNGTLTDSNANFQTSANISADDAEKVAAELSRVTGRKFSAATETNATANITAKDILLTGEKLSKAGKSLDLQIGDTSDSFNKLSVKVQDMHVDAMGLSDVNIGSQEGAAAAMDKIKAAVNYVSDTRGTLGALQNRLDHTINNLGVMKENITSSESLIRDTDVADEMTSYTKNNILNQAAQAMLAQANQMPQGVLQLLG